MTRSLLLLPLILLVGCGGSAPPSPTPTPVEPVAMKAEGLQNLFRVSDRVYSGSSPEGDEGFASLERLGVKTVITVDGAKPDVATAEKHGLRYVHLPIGYDGIPADRATQLAKAVRDLPGPVYIHCHHGQHRGPAACVVVQLSLDPTWTPERAEQWLAAAGTDAKYSGLCALPRTFKIPSAVELDAAPNDFPTTAPVPDLVRVMVDVDNRWDNLKEAKANGWKTPPNHPDIDPPHEAVMLTELFREATRLEGSTAKGKQFVALLGEAETAAKELEAALRKGDGQAATAAFSRAQATCASCHPTFRDKK